MGTPSWPKRSLRTLPHVYTLPSPAMQPLWLPPQAMTATCFTAVSFPTARLVMSRGVLRGRCGQPGRQSASQL